MKLLVTSLESPAGRIVFARTAQGLAALAFAERWPGIREELARRFGALEEEPGAGGRDAVALARYFEGDVAAIDSLPVDLGGTPFQARVWKELRRVPPGRTVTYRELAARAGRPAAIRAAGAANARNPVSIVVPCHRVVGSDGSLTGYGGGLARKRWLLDHEAAAVSARGRTRAS